MWSEIECYSTCYFQVVHWVSFIWMASVMITVRRRFTHSTRHSQEISLSKNITSARQASQRKVPRTAIQPIRVGGCWCANVAMLTAMNVWVPKAAIACHVLMASSFCQNMSVSKCLSWTRSKGTWICFARILPMAFWQLLPFAAWGHFLSLVQCS